jgi:hypothetical protein
MKTAGAHTPFIGQSPLQERKTSTHYEAISFADHHILEREKVTRIGIVAELGQETRVAATPTTVSQIAGVGLRGRGREGRGRIGVVP